MMDKYITPILKFFAWAIPVALLAWFAYTLIQHTKPQVQDKTQEIRITVNFNNKPVEGTETVETTRQVPVVCPFSGETKTSEVKTVVKKTKSEPSERRVVVTEDAFKETMQKVAYAARQEAQNEYDKNFSILLTILTIFGIAWPVIIALLQFKFNEKEIKKIKKLQNRTKKTLHIIQENERNMYLFFAKKLYLSVLDKYEDICTKKCQIEIKISNQERKIQTPLIKDSKKEAEQIAGACLDLLEASRYFVRAICVSENKYKTVADYSKYILDIGDYIKNMFYNYGQDLSKYSVIDDLITEIQNIIQDYREIVSDFCFMKDVIDKLQESKDLLWTNKNTKEH